MNKFSFWGWTLILLGIYLITVLATAISQFTSFGYSMDILHVVFYYILPAFWGLILLALVAGFAAMVGKNIFSTQKEGFFITANCMLLAEILMRMSWPVIMKLMNYFEQLSGIFGGRF